MNQTELLAPVGCEENFYAAINYGANAVYIGLSDFSARKNASNFSLERLPYFLSYAHIFGVKVYIAVNTLIKNSELEKYFDVIGQAYAAGADAFIVQDIFLGRALKKTYPNICLHLSTQAGVNNVIGAKQALAFGFSRVILARETHISQIRKISQIIETEVFVHGALCTCFSGHCYLSSFIGGKSGNRGFCRQPCRKLYSYQGDGISDTPRYALSLSDLGLYNKVDELILSGVKSFKIEGRMRSFEYVCAACDFYSELLKGSFNKTKLDNLTRTYNRGGYTEGLTFGQNKTLLSDKIQNHCGQIIGKVAAVKGDEITPSLLKCNIKEGDCFKILYDGKEIGNAVAICKNSKIVIKFRQKAFVGCDLAITKDVSLIEKYRAYKKSFLIKCDFFAAENQPMSLTVNGKKYSSDYLPQKAITSAVTKSEVKDNLRKSDIYPFVVTPTCDLQGSLFIVKKHLNELRSSAYSDYFYSFANKRNVNVKALKNVDIIRDFCEYYDTHNDDEVSVTVISNCFDFNVIPNIQNLVFCPFNYNSSTEFDIFFTQAKKFDGLRKTEKYLYVPPYLNSDDEKIICERAALFDGLYCEGAFGLYLAKRLKKKFYGGIELNITNNLSYSVLKNEGADNVALSKELSENELKDFKNVNMLALGGIKVMSLIYCPFSKKCIDCKRKDIFFLKDESRTFRVRRYKLSSCRFEIYNCAYLKTNKKMKNVIFDFNTLNKREITELLAAYENHNFSVKSLPLTFGNLSKGVD